MTSNGDARYAHVLMLLTMHAFCQLIMPRGTAAQMRGTCVHEGSGWRRRVLKPLQLFRHIGFSTHDVDVMRININGRSHRLAETNHTPHVAVFPQAPFFATAQLCRLLVADMLNQPGRNFQIAVPQSPVAYLIWPGATMYASNRYTSS